MTKLIARWSQTTSKGESRPTGESYPKNLKRCRNWPWMNNEVPSKSCVYKWHCASQAREYGGLSNSSSNSIPHSPLYKKSRVLSDAWVRTGCGKFIKQRGLREPIELTWRELNWKAKKKNNSSTAREEPSISAPECRCQQKRINAESHLWLPQMYGEARPSGFPPALACSGHASRLSDRILTLEFFRHIGHYQL